MLRLTLIAQPQQPEYNNAAFSYEEKVRKQSDCLLRYNRREKGRIEEESMRIDLPEALLDLTSWDRLSIQECEQFALSVGAHLPPGFRFTHVVTYEAGTQRRHIAHFEWQPSSTQEPSLFSLIPGSTSRLGFDRAHPFAVDKELVLDWQRYCLECGDDFVDVSTSHMIELEPGIPHYEMFYDYLTHILHPVRTVTFQPLLVEVQVEEASMRMTQQHVVAFLKKQGFRLLTADEWEYVCAADSRTLFYWVDEQFEYRSEAASWSELRNAFGLAIARDAINIDVPYDYEWEYCADPTIMKGFDGGLIGYDTSYLALASAYRQLLSDKQMTQGVSGGCFRRVFGLMEKSG